MPRVSEKVVFVTVGTTEFNQLIEEINKPQVHHSLQSKGYTKAIIQYGRGHSQPKESATGLQIQSYRYSEDYKRDIAQADLIISHAGAGSIMDALSAKKKLVVVINSELMDNHQTELADELQSQNYLIATTIDKFQQTLAELTLDHLRLYQDPDSQPFADLIDQEMGLER